ncbi:phage portal protein [Methylobacterium sp. J-090]|uniref:phage portal protein n=1 Tax=Methylobacterium sp. J-090 TaxID=2836666 RepID=UPI001FB9FFA1|nr:phage portal protein [Methylobacterium sp. J-090]MCJ2080740.1 phage portal protein [Methylobacterium sp. J-090]
MAAPWNRSGPPGIGASRRRATMTMPEVETAHHAASSMAKDMATWPTHRMSPDAALLPELDTINARVDDLVRNNGIAAGAERTFVDNVVGPRITCKPNPDYVRLGKTSGWVDGWAREVEAEFRTFTDTDWFDAGLRYNFHVSTRLQARMIAATGEALALPLWTKRNGSLWNTCVQLVDPARLSNPFGEAETTTFRGGIELDKVTTAATAYHIRKTHPGDALGLFGGLSGAHDWERVPAYMPWGRRRVIHLFESERVGQTRGKAVIASVARQFKMFDHMNREQLRLAVLNSLIFAALETPLNAEQIENIFGESEKPMEAYQASLDDWRIQMKGGSMVTLPPGTTMKPFAPNQQMTGLDTFATVMLRSIGAGLNMPYELVFRDFSKTNYSSARASLLEAWRYFASVRQFIIDHWCSSIYDLWFEEACQRGHIPDCTPDDYYGNQIAWTRAKWIFAGRGWVDPLKEAKAATERLNSKISTLSDECGEQGRDWREQIDQDAREKAYQKQSYKALGLSWPPAQAAQQPDVAEAPDEAIPA